MDLLKKYDYLIEKITKYDFVDAVIIFGSYSTGKIKPLSDLDICVICKPNIKVTEENEILSYNTEKFDISLFHKLPLSLQFKIIKNGKVILTKIDLDDIKNKTINKWFDFKPILDRLYESRGYPKAKL